MPILEGHHQDRVSQAASRIQSEESRKVRNVSNTVTENFSQRSQAGEEAANAYAPRSNLRVRISAHPAVESDSSDISTDSIMEGIRNNQMQTGRKPVPFAEYLTTRQLKIDHL